LHHNESSGEFTEFIVFSDTDVLNCTVMDEKRVTAGNSSFHGCSHYNTTSHPTTAGETTFKVGLGAFWYNFTLDHQCFANGTVTTAKLIDNEGNCVNGFGNLSYENDIVIRNTESARFIFEGTLDGSSSNSPIITDGDDAGSHSGSDNAAVLTDSTKGWTVNEWVGGTIGNVNDGSTGTITANTATTITAVLSGGTEDDWDTGDDYVINPTGIPQSNQGFQCVNVAQQDGPMTDANLTDYTARRLRLFGEQSMQQIFQMSGADKNLVAIASDQANDAGTGLVVGRMNDLEPTRDFEPRIGLTGAGAIQLYSPIAASAVTTVNSAIRVYDAAGVEMGWVPVYTTRTP